mgnify:CR=1 FL=1
MSAVLYLSEPFAQRALVAGVLVAITCGLVAPFVVMRGLAFAVHGTSELAFTGAAAGLLIADDPLLGALAGALVVAAVIGALGVEERERDAAIGWTGSELFVYGKSATNFNSAVGGLYSPASNTWREVSTNGGPVGSSGHQWVYTGTELIGFSLSRFHAFNPQSNSWRPCSTNGMPSPTQIDNGAMTKPPKLFWTGSEVGMAIAKETSPTQRSVAVYLYHPQADSWRTIADNSISIYPGSPTFPPQWTGNSALFYLPVTNGDIYNTLVLRPFRFTPPKTLYFYQKP